MKLLRRETQVFTLSFLDCICCGFGAIILLLVLTEFGSPVVFEKSRKDLKQQVLKLQATLFEIRGESERLNRAMQGRVATLSKEQLNLARARGELSSVQGQFSDSKSDAAVSSIVESELTAAYQSLSEDMAKLLAKSRERRKISTDAVGGIPVDSEYIIILIDTSGSMLSGHWETAQGVLREILSIYPKVKGIQVIDDNGKEMLSGTRGQWLQDSPGMRDRLVETMKNWRAFSDSNPADGIEIAIRNYYSEDKRISLYVLGDEFTGDSIQQALDAVRKVNHSDQRGRRRFRIHAVGFSEGQMAPFTNIRFAALMRYMCEQNDGTFVGLTSEKSCAASISIGGTTICLGGD